MKPLGTNLPAYGVIALLLGVLASTVALTWHGSLSGADAKDVMFAVLGIFGLGAAVGGGAVAVNQGVKSATAAHVAATTAQK